MTTRCYVVKKTDDYSFVGVMVKCDGWPQAIGKVLTTFYTNEERVDELIATGGQHALSDKLEQLGEDNYYSHTRFGTNELIEFYNHDPNTEYIHVWVYGRWRSYHVDWIAKILEPGVWLDNIEFDDETSWESNTYSELFGS